MLLWPLRGGIVDAAAHGKSSENVEIICRWIKLLTFTFLLFFYPFSRARWVISRLQAQYRGRTTRNIMASKKIQSTSPLGESCPLTVQDALLERIERLESVDCCLFPLAQCSLLTKLHRIERLEYVFDPRQKIYNAAVTIERWYRGCLSRAR